MSRRVFLCGAAGVAIVACSDDSATSGSTAGTSVDTTDTTVAVSEAPTTTVAATTTSTLPDVELVGDPFTLGVASGDPDATSVVLWTRLAPEPYAGGGMPADDIGVLWEVSATSDFAEIIRSGTETATAAHAHSVHATAELDQGAWYYRFRVGTYTSPVDIAPPTTYAITGSVAIQPSGARLKPTRPLMAMKVTLLVRNKPWQIVSSQRLRFMFFSPGSAES